MAESVRVVLCFAAILVASLPPASGQDKRLITLDEFMNATDVKEVKLSGDGTAAVIATVDADWQHNRFASDLWI